MSTSHVKKRIELILLITREIIDEEVIRKARPRKWYVKVPKAETSLLIAKKIKMILYSSSSSSFSTAMKSDYVKTGIKESNCFAGPYEGETSFDI